MQAQRWGRFVLRAGERGENGGEHRRTVSQVRGHPPGGQVGLHGKGGALEGLETRPGGQTPLLWHHSRQIQVSIPLVFL